MSAFAGLIVSSNAAGAAATDALTSLPSGVAAVRLDVEPGDDVDAARIREYCRRPLIYHLRGGANGGADRGPDEARQQRLRDAARHFDFIELDAECDLAPDLLAVIAPSRRVISWHGAACDAVTLARRFATMARVPAALYVLAPCGQRFADTIAPLHLLDGLGRRDLVAYDAGPVGFWTRVIAPRFGAPAVFVDADEPAGLPDPDAIAALIDDYDLHGLPASAPVTALYGIVGPSVRRSLSPRLHNARYRADGRAAMFVPIPAPELADVCASPTVLEELARLNLGLRGLTVTAPFKEAALALAHSRSAPAAIAGSANLLLRRDGGWHAETTDPQGILDALAARHVALRRLAAAVIGCGGAGRAIAAALRDAGAKVTLVNRSPRAGHAAARKLGLCYVPLTRLQPARYALLVNATPVGTDGVSSLVDPQALDANAIVVDLGYGRGVTPLVAGARARGLTVIDGLEVLDHQVRHQYERMAQVGDARDPPREAGLGFGAAPEPDQWSGWAVASPGA
jgi:3-dehydroquinate dehydratase/shikimate dehydrogenase